MKRVLEDVRGRLERLGDELMLQTFQEWTTSFDALHERQSLQMLEGCFNAVWDVYKATLIDPSYYFSIHELLLFSRLASVNLVVTRYEQNNCYVLGSTVTSSHMSSAVYVRLQGDNSGRVRGHFERMWKMSEVEECRVALIFECETKAEEETRRVAAAERAAKQVAEEKIRENEETLSMQAEDRRQQEHVLHAHDDAEDTATRR